MRQITISIEKKPFGVKSDNGITHFDCDLTFTVDDDILTPIEFSNIWVYLGKNAAPTCISNLGYKFGEDGGSDLESISQAIYLSDFHSEMEQEMAVQRFDEAELQEEAAREMGA